MNSMSDNGVMKGKWTKFLTNSIKSEKMAYYKLSNTLYFR